ncbi:WD40-repeat-containing domain protein [Chlamydoabsidia padenii]|nr:WD40-repeat-containing domain protein [Chlamydoabsidia padenii]
MSQSLSNRFLGEDQAQTIPTETTPETEATSDDSSPQQTQTQELIPSPPVSSMTHNNGSSSSNNSNLNDDDDGTLCPICKDVFTGAFVTRCGHSFCYSCITRHLDEQLNCPICRHGLNKSQISPNFQLMMMIERQQAQPKLRHSTNASTDSSLKLLANYIDALPNTEDVQSILSNAIIKRRKLKVRENEIRSNLLSCFLTIAQNYASKETRKWNKNRNMAYQDLLSLGCNRQISNRTIHDPEIITSLDSNESAIDDVNNSEGDDDNSSNKTDNQLPSEQSSKKQLRKRKYTDEDDGTSHSAETNELERILVPRKIRLQRHLPELMDLYFNERRETTNGLDSFSSTIYQMTRYSNWQPLDSIYYADLETNSAIVSSIEFDRDEEYIAVGGVTKEIKIYDYNMVNEKADERTMVSINEEENNEEQDGSSSSSSPSSIGSQGQQHSPLPRSIGGRNSAPGLVHCPLQTIHCDYKISCLSWNPHIKSSLASSDYEGIVNIWDTTTGRNVHRYEEHEKRAWSVDTSLTNPTILASGSDDSTVKIWSIKSRWSVLTLQQRGNICCAKFAPNSEHLIAVGSADHHITCYDLRNPKEQLQVFSGHNKAVSYVKWNNDKEITSASTDNTLKSWKLGVDGCTRTYSGHRNEKNFVGLSLKDDWIACGSENNTLYTYHKNSSHPVAHYKFPVMDPITWQESYTDESLFVSSVCWKSDSMKILAANSKGIIKVLQLVE